MADQSAWTDWRDTNRAVWDDRVPTHLEAESYSLDALRAGNAKLHPIEEAELGSVDGLRILHLQCHFGRDSLILAQKGAAEVVGLDFSGPAVEAGNRLAGELGLHARFVQADLYDAPTVLPEPERFDLVFVSWGAICWLNDIRRWAEIVAYFIKPGGAFYIAEAHPAAWVFDDRVTGDAILPGPLVPYFSDSPFVDDAPLDYASGGQELPNARNYSWIHPLGDTVTALIDAGLRLKWLHEHTSVPWPMFKHLIPAEGDMYRWPDKPWLPLSFSLRAEKEGTA